ncbi:MAG TPA: TonB-dependent receptor [Edaphocola sp.]|nr:TonB-dependent receptor [Edaphocola sp.]
MAFFVKRLLLPLYFLIIPFLVIAQNNFEDTLSNIIITSKKIKFHQDTKSELNTGQTSDSIAPQTLKLYHNLSVATLLSQQAPVFVKSYGVNNMSSLSFRGSSAAQSLVLWKGIPLNNPSLGIADISTLQTGMFDNITVNYGANASLLGSGNIGGALYLDNILSKKSKIEIAYGIGSFGRRESSYNGQWTHKKLSIGLKAHQQKLINNFEYNNINGTRETMTNANLNAYGLMLSSVYSINRYQSLSLDIWHQKYYRQIPKAMFETFSNKEQTDKALRTLLNWNFKKDNTNFYAKFSLNNENLDYSDSFYNVFSTSKTLQYYQEVGWKQDFRIPKYNAAHKILLFSAYQYTQLKNSSSNIPYQSRPSLIGAYQYLHGKKRWAFQANFRQEWTNGKPNPSLLGAGTEYEIFNQEQWQFKLKAGIQKTFRIPTLNELYNNPGGNPNLKPEQGWNKEFASVINWKNKKGNINFRQQSNYFNRTIKDWIYWLGGAIWTPHNLAKVYNRGIETSNNINFELNNKTKVYFSLKTAYVLSTTLKSYMPNDSSIGKQIPYAPRYSGNLNLGFQIENFNFNYNQNYTGYRFITTDESLYLKPYHTGNIQFSYIFYFKKLCATLNAQVQNIWNESYQVVAYRPMPNRFYCLGLQLGL